MIRSLLPRGALAAIVLTAAAPAFAQAPPPAASPACQRLEAQLTALDRGNSDPARAQQIRSAEDAVNRQQVEVDRLVSQSRRMGCESSGFFSIFSNPPPACGPLVRQIGQRRSQLERMQNDLERLSGGTTERAAQRQSLLIALGNNGCGPQYRSAALAGERAGFFDNLFGNNNSNVYSPGPMGGTFRTICVRTCDGFYFPVSYATSPDRFRDDEQTCQRMCPAAETQLYTYHNPGEEVTQAVSLTGKLYTELPTAFQYRKSLDAACSCRRAGETWYDALKTSGPDYTVAPGDVVVTEESAKKLSLPRIGPDGKPIKYDPPPKNAAAPLPPKQPDLADAPGQPDPAKRTVRTVGPTFLPPR